MTCLVAKVSNLSALILYIYKFIHSSDTLTPKNSTWTRTTSRSNLPLPHSVKKGKTIHSLKLRVYTWQMVGTLTFPLGMPSSKMVELVSLVEHLFFATKKWSQTRVFWGSTFILLALEKGVSLSQFQSRKNCALSPYWQYIPLINTRYCPCLRLGVLESQAHLLPEPE